MKRLFTAVLLTIMLLGGKSVTAADLRLVIIDVGMGQSVLLVEDGHGLLIDTGLAASAPHVLARMEEHGVRELDYLILSHLHPDHAAGYPAIREAWPETPVLDNCHLPAEIESSNRDLILKIGDALAQDPLRSCLSAGDRLQWQGHELQVLWPGTPQGKDLNHNSLVLLFSSREGAQVLIMGDVDKEVEKGLATALPPSLVKKTAAVYVAAHHAAEDSTEPRFLRRIRPHFSVVSVGRDNIYGYPADESLATLEEYSGTVLRTDRDGEVCFVLKGNDSIYCGGKGRGKQSVQP